MAPQMAVFDLDVPREASDASRPGIRRVPLSALREVMRDGLRDFARNRTDLIFMCVIYPAIGFFLAERAVGADMLPILFPLLTGFALVGPVAAVGLNEMSRRLELGEQPGAFSMFGVLRSPQRGGIAVFALILAVLFVAWVATAMNIYSFTMGAAHPDTVGGFLRSVLLTRAGWALIVLGMGAGFVFAVIVLCLSLVTFPLLLDRRISVFDAIYTSLRASAANKEVVAVWGAMLAGAMIAGSVPALLGLAFVLPIFGHATWHLYRRMVV